MLQCDCLFLGEENRAKRKREREMVKMVAATPGGVILDHIIFGVVML